MPLVISALLYGRSGTGKTTVAGTFPTKNLLLDISEMGTDSVMDIDGMDHLEINEWDDFEDIYWDLKDGLLDYSTVTIDAVHSLQQLAIIEAKYQNNKGPNEMVSRRDFGTAAGLLNTWIVNYRDLIKLGIHVVFLCHDRLTEGDEDEENGMMIPEVGPRVMPSVASTLLGAVNIVGHTFIREQVTKTKKAGSKSQRKVDYCLRLGPHGYYATKIRNPKKFHVPDFIEDPTFDKIVEIVKGKVAPAMKKKAKAGKVRRKK